MITRAFLPSAPSSVCYPGLQPWFQATVPGVLLDDGGFPAVAHGEDGVVKGWVHAFVADDHDGILALLDRHHQVGASPHARTLCVATEIGGGHESGPCHAWTWTGPMDLPVVADGDWSYQEPDLPLSTRDQTR